MLQYGYRRNAPKTRSARGAGYNWANYSAIVDRPPLRWPNDARIALWICPNILHFEYAPPADPWLDSWPRMTPPDVLAYGRQEYGVRVGFWRMLEVLDKHRARCTAVVNSSALERFPEICAASIERGWDYVGHGQYNTRFIFGHEPVDELTYHTALRARVEQLTGVRISGTGGPGPQAATENTPDVLAAAGFTYYTDWFFDDQPFPLNVKSGRLIALPYTVEINDPSFLGSAFEADQFADAVKRQFDVLYEEGERSGRVMCISLHGYLFGQPQRARYLDEALQYVLSFPGVWQATGAEIAKYYMANCYDRMIEHLVATGAAR